MDTRRGRFPITSFVLLALLKKAQADGATFSNAEQTLYSACDFSAAAAGRDLARHLGSQSTGRLRGGYAALSAIGAVRVASVLHVLRGEVPREPSPLWVRDRAARLEEQLLDTEDTVDQLVARYALEHLNDERYNSRRLGSGRASLPDRDDS
jgi:hypothetical protein